MTTPRDESEQTLRMKAPPTPRDEPSVRTRLHDEDIDKTIAELVQSIESGAIVSAMDRKLFTIVLKNYTILKGFSEASGKRYTSLDDSIDLLADTVRDVSARVSGLGADVSAGQKMIGELGVSVEALTSEVRTSNTQHTTQYESILGSLRGVNDRHLDHMQEHASRDQIAAGQDARESKADLRRDAEIAKLMVANNSLEKERAMLAANNSALTDSLRNVQAKVVVVEKKADSALVATGKNGGLAGVIVVTAELFRHWMGW